MPRSSIAAATAPPWRAGSATRTQICLRVGAAGEQVLDLAGDRLGLGALVGALPEADRRLAEAMLEDDHIAVGMEVAEPGLGGSRGSCGRARASVLGPPRPPRSCAGRPRARRGGSGCRWRGRSGLRVELGSPPRARRPSGTRSARRSGGGRRGVRRRGSRGRGRRRRGRGCRRWRGCGRGLCRARRTRARGGRPRAGGLVGAASLGLAGALLQPGRPDPFRLQRVDPRQQPRQQAGRVAADLVPAQRQLVEAVEQHRQPLGRAEHVEEGVEAGGLGVLAQQPLADRVPAADPELLERALAAAPRPVRAAAARWRGWSR